MNKFDYILGLIQEDSVDSPANSVVPGSELPVSIPKTNSEFTTVSDLLKYNKGMDTGDTTNKVLGVPLQLIMDELVLLYVKTLDVRNKFKEAAQNPVYRDREAAKKPLELSDRLINSILANIKAIAKQLDNLTLD